MGGGGTAGDWQLSWTGVSYGTLDVVLMRMLERRKGIYGHTPLTIAVGTTRLGTGRQFSSVHYRTLVNTQNPWQKYFWFFGGRLGIRLACIFEKIKQTVFLV